MHFPAASVFVLYHPATVAAYEQAGMSLFTQPIWRNDLYRSDRHLSVVGEGPADHSVTVDVAVPTKAGLEFSVFSDGTVQRLADID
jgi:hypothetical protein